MGGQAISVSAGVGEGGTRIQQRERGQVRSDGVTQLRREAQVLRLHLGQVHVAGNEDQTEGDEQVPVTFLAQCPFASSSVRAPPPVLSPDPSRPSCHRPE